MSILTVRDLVVSRGSSQVLNGVSLSVEAGEVVTVLGSNGMGKSTLLRTISGLHRPLSGEIEFMGQRVEGRNPRVMVQAGVIHVPEGRQLFPGLSVRENLELGAHARKGSRLSLDEVIAYLPGLAGWLKRPAGTLSGGQQQMVALGRGLIAKPLMLLLDEPTLGLAPMVIGDLRATILRLKEAGFTSLLVEQNAHMALGVADRAYVLVHGRVAISGSASELATDETVRAAYLGG
jgi:branched-chain amino acid transport system ATP-binding protein